MIIYGSRSTELATAAISDKCESCGTAKTVQMSIFQKYAHIFWIPFFPIGKTGLIYCSHCKHTLEKKEFNASLKQEYETLKMQSKMPLWIFSGFAVVAALATWGVIINNQNKAENEKNISNVQKGDVYEIKMGYKQYTLYKVERVAGDSVFMLFHQYESNKLSGLSDLKKQGDSGYSEVSVPFVKSDLKAMLDKGEVVGIDKK
jgi:hypothetical protein